MAHRGCAAFRLLVEWPPFEQWEGAPFVVAGRWNVTRVELGLVTVTLCQVWMVDLAGFGACWINYRTLLSDAVAGRCCQTLYWIWLVDPAGFGAC